jgi:hypothetical protein
MSYDNNWVIFFFSFFLKKIVLSFPEGCSINTSDWPKKVEFTDWHIMALSKKVFCLSLPRHRVTPFAAHSKSWTPMSCQVSGQGEMLSRYSAMAP